MRMGTEGGEKGGGITRGVEEVKEEIARGGGAGRNEGRYVCGKGRLLGEGDNGGK